MGADALSPRTLPRPVQDGGDFHARRLISRGADLTAWLDRVAPTAIRSFQTVLGPMVAAASARGIIYLKLGAGVNEGPQAELRKLQREVENYLAGRLREFGVPLDPTGLSPFRVEAYHATMQIPYGKTKSYAWLGAQIGASARTAGMAMAGCPYLLLVPCQRVIKADGSLGGFGGREEVKIWLLDLERLHSRPT